MTAQTRELFDYQGARRRIPQLPLESCPNRDRVPDFGYVSSGCWRGYTGHWGLVGDSLHLIGVYSPNGDEGSNVLGEMFPEHSGSVEASWFSGCLYPDDVVEPTDELGIAIDEAFGSPVHHLWFTVIVHRGKVLLEERVDVRTWKVESRLTDHAGLLFAGHDLAFLREIREEFDKLDSRLVYADWLEDQEDPRSEILRKEIDRLRTGHPSRAWIEDRCSDNSWSPPSGFVEPDDVEWFWHKLVGIPVLSDEEKERVETFERIKQTSRSHIDNPPSN